MDRLKTAFQQRIGTLFGALVFIAALVLYIRTLAPGVVFGDPAEYTFVPHIWGIAHPPGYAFQTVLGGIWQRLVPIGSIAYRANLLSAFAGAGVAACVYGAVTHIGGKWFTETHWQAIAAGVIAAASTITATDIWQHSIHANAHITSVLLASLSVYLLVSWWRYGGHVDGPSSGWLYAFCMVAGLSVTHHPLLVFSFPAYTAFILVVRPEILFPSAWKSLFTQPKVFFSLEVWAPLLKMVGFGLLGLTVWLYLPVRNMLPAPLSFGPQNTDTLNGFLDLVFARGLRVNLFYYGWAEQPDRLIVFWSLLRLQAAWPLIALMVVGLAGLWARVWHLALLLTVSTVFNIAFTINTIQDVMAYLMVPFALLMVMLGAGALLVLYTLDRVDLRYRPAIQAAFVGVMLVFPTVRAVQLAPRVSLTQFTDARQWVREVDTYFTGRGESAYLLAHWEHLTPLWYEEFVTAESFPPEDVTLVFVAANSPTPWLDNTQALFGQGPIYVSGYQPELIRAGYRLHPIGQRMYRVVEAGASIGAEPTTPLARQAGPVTLVGVTWGNTTAQPGERVPLFIAMRIEEPVTDLYFPYARMDDTVFNFTTDSHVITPDWLPGETIVERYDIRVPFDAPPGEYPVELALRNLTRGQTLTFASGAEAIEIGRITVTTPSAQPVPHTDLLADIGHQVGLVDARVSGGGETRTGLWDEPMQVGPYDRLSVRLRWRALAPPDDNWKVFVHLIDEAGRVVTQVDAPPLGGAFPTYLWFPKWVPGQEVIDPYTLSVPGDIPAGRYRIQVGLYGFNTLQRVGVYSLEGDLIGDRVILGPVELVP